MSLNKIVPLPSREVLQKLLMYEDGKLFWKHLTFEDALTLGVCKTEAGWKRRTMRYVGKQVGHAFTTTAGTKSHQSRVFGRSYYTHRLIYKLLTGEEPLLIDHINGNPLDNRISNLRSVNNQTNAKNMSQRYDNTSGQTGVSWDKAHQKWEAYIWKDYKKHHLGLFEDKLDAIQARLGAEIKFNFHANHGRNKVEC